MGGGANRLLQLEARFAEPVLVASELVVVAVVFLLFWVGCSYAIARNSSLESWLRYLDALLLPPVLLSLILVNIYATWLVAPVLVELAEPVASGAGTRFAAPIAFVACAPLPVAAFVFWRRGIARLNRPLDPR